jgi:hypothetical protein
MWYTDLIICMLNTVSNMFLNPKTNLFILYMMERSGKNFLTVWPLKKTEQVLNGQSFRHKNLGLTFLLF